MNIRIFVLSFILMLGVGTGLVAQNKKAPLKNDKEIILFEVSMTCENCQKRLEKTIAFEKGVTDMKIDLGNKTVRIEFKKAQTTVENLKAAIEKLGYEVKIHKEENE